MTEIYDKSGKALNLDALQANHRKALDNWFHLRDTSKDTAAIAKAKAAADEAGNAWATANEAENRRKKGLAPNTGAATSIFGSLFGQ